MRGTVIKYDRSKGYGFVISTEDLTMPDLFVHFSAIQAISKHHKFLVPGQTVEFEPVDLDTNPRAINVRVIGVTIARQLGADRAGSVRP